MATDDDVPITVDFRVAETTRAWTDEADRKRPHRAQMRDAFAERIAKARTILELPTVTTELELEGMYLVSTR